MVSPSSRRKNVKAKNISRREFILRVTSLPASAVFLLALIGRVLMYCGICRCECDVPSNEEVINFFRFCAGWVTLLNKWAILKCESWTNMKPELEVKLCWDSQKLLSISIQTKAKWTKNNRFIASMAGGTSNRFYLASWKAWQQQIHYVETKETENLSKYFVCLEYSSCREQLWRFSSRTLVGIWRLPSPLKIQNQSCFQRRRLCW